MVLGASLPNGFMALNKDILNWINWVICSHTNCTNFLSTFSVNHASVDFLRGIYKCHVTIMSSMEVYKGQGGKHCNQFTLRSGHVLFDWKLQGKCQRNTPPCKYLHPPGHLQEQLLQTGKQNLAMKNLQAQAVAVAGFPPVLQLAGSNPNAVYPVVSNFFKPFTS